MEVKTKWLQSAWRAFISPAILASIVGFCCGILLAGKMNEQIINTWRNVVNTQEAQINELAGDLRLCQDQLNFLGF